MLGSKGGGNQGVGGGGGPRSKDSLYAAGVSLLCEIAGAAKSSAQNAAETHTHTHTCTHTHSHA
jgi:hypothetical protein